MFVCLIIVYFIPGGEELSIFTYRQGTVMENKFLPGCERIHGARTNWRQEMMKFKEQPEGLAHWLSNLSVP